MIGPQNLLAAGQRDASEREMSGVARCKRHVASGVPVLCQKHTSKAVRQVVDDRNDRVSIGDSKAAASAEVILNINDHECCVHSEIAE